MSLATTPREHSRILESAHVGNGSQRQEIINLSKREGFLAKQLYVIFTTPAGGMKPVMDNIKEHLAFQVQLEKDGIMFAAGPNWAASLFHHGGNPRPNVNALPIVQALDLDAEISEAGCDRVRTVRSL